LRTFLLGADCNLEGTAFLGWTDDRVQDALSQLLTGIP
jgi:hypothetical protein